jgi:HK97 family phage portal protein
MDRVKTVTSIPTWLSDLTNDPDKVRSSAQAYTYVPLVFRAVRLRANAIQAVPITITRGGGEVEVDWPYPEPLSSLLWRTSAALDLTGCAYWEILANKSRYQKDVKYRNPYDIAVEYLRATKQIGFKQNSTGAHWVNTPDKGLYEMVYFAEFDPTQDILPGVSSAEVSLASSQLLRYMVKFAGAFFEGGAMPVTMLAMENVSDDERVRVETWFKRSVTAVKNAFRVLGVRAGMVTPSVLTPPMKDLVIPELYQQARREVALAFEIPQTMLEDAANFATAKEHRLSFYEDTIKPRAMMLEDIINQQLLAKDGLKLAFDFEELSIFQEDEANRASSLSALTGAGVPLNLAMDILGYELDEDQLAMLNAETERKELAAEEMRQRFAGAQNQPPQPPQEQPDEDDGDMEREMRRWLRKALKRVKDGKPAACEFTSEIIPAGIAGAVRGSLDACATADDVKAVFDGVLAWRAYP